MGRENDQTVSGRQKIVVSAASSAGNCNIVTQNTEQKQAETVPLSEGSAIHYVRMFLKKDEFLSFIQCI